jgi:ribonucleoside-diphosphate reductase alpha chain
MGSGVEEGTKPTPGPEAVVSRGLVRGKVAERLKVVEGAKSTSGGQPAGSVSHTQTAASAIAAVFGATALKQDAAYETRPATAGKTEAKTDTVAERRAEARMKGYEGESCSECGNFTMVRNGTCLKCDTCGSTSGCS